MTREDLIEAIMEMVKPSKKITLTKRVGKTVWTDTERMLALMKKQKRLKK